MKNVFLNEIADWFVLIKAPDLKDKITEAVELVEQEKSLSENQKKLLGFICFSFSMNRGPVSFTGVVMVVKDIGVQAEFEEYANKWIDHSKTNP